MRWTRLLLLLAGSYPKSFRPLDACLKHAWDTLANRYVQVLRLMETFSPEETEAAVKQALQLGAIGFDAVKHLLLCSIEQKAPKAQS